MAAPRARWSAWLLLSVACVTAPALVVAHTDGRLVRRARGRTIPRAAVDGRRPQVDAMLAGVAASPPVVWFEPRENARSTDGYSHSGSDARS